MIYFDADVDIPLEKHKMEEIRLIKVPKEDEFLFFKEYHPEKEEYILVRCLDGYVLIALPRD